MIYRILVAMSVVGFLTTSCSAPENRHILPPDPSLRPSAQASPAMNPAQASAPPQTSNPPRPTTSPELPASQSASFSPQYLDTFPLGASASKLFQISTPTGNQVAWQNRQGNLNIYQQGTQFQEVYFTPTLSHTTFVAGVWRPAGKSLLMVREEEPTGNPDYDYPINSRAITLEDGKTINNRAFQKFQVHSLEMDDKGNGYMLLSDEYPRPGAREDTRPVTSFYYSRVEQYIPSEPQMLFQTDSVSLFGKRNTLDSVIDQNGSGFFIHRNSAGQMILHSFSHLKVDPETQSLNLPYAYDYSLSKSADGYVLTCFYEQTISSTNRNTKQYIHLQPTKTIDS